MPLPRGNLGLANTEPEMLRDWNPKSGTGLLAGYTPIPSLIVDVRTRKIGNSGAYDSVLARGNLHSATHRSQTGGGNIALVLHITLHPNR